MKKKLISALLTLCMVLSLLPASALAADATVDVTYDGTDLFGDAVTATTDNATGNVNISVDLTKLNARKTNLADKLVSNNGYFRFSSGNEIDDTTNGAQLCLPIHIALTNPSDTVSAVTCARLKDVSGSTGTNMDPDNSNVSMSASYSQDKKTVNEWPVIAFVNLKNDNGTVSWADTDGDFKVNDKGASANLTEWTYRVTWSVNSAEYTKDININVTTTPTPTTYTVSFNAGTGASGTMADETVNKAATGDTTYILPECAFTASSNQEFAGWKVNDEETPKAAGTEITLTGNVTLTATWRNKATVTEQYTIKFAAGTGASGTMADKTVAKAENGNTTYTIPTSTFTAPEGKEFDKWTVSGTGLTVSGSTLTIPENVSTTESITLTATWKDKTTVTPTPTEYTVNFDAGTGASGTMAAVKVEKAATGDTTYTLPECTFTAPTGKTFAGWKVGDANGVQPAGAVVTLTADTTMTAIWADEAKADAPVEVTNNTATATVTAPATVKAGDVVTIDASKDEAGNEIPANVTSSEIQLPKEAVNTLKGASSVEITTPTGTVTLPQAALNTIANDSNVTDTAPATLTVAQTSEEAAVTPPSTSTEVKATFEVKVSVGNHEIELSASDLNNQFIKLALNIGRGLTNPAVYYVEDNGTLGDILGVGKAYNPTDGSITVLAPHLSNFAVVASKQTTGDLALTSGVKEGNFVSTTLTGMTAGNYYLVQTKTDSSHFTFITFKAQDTSMKFTVNSGNTVEVWESKTDITFNGYVPTTDGTGHVDATTITAAN